MFDGGSQAPGRAPHRRQGKCDDEGLKDSGATALASVFGVAALGDAKGGSSVTAFFFDELGRGIGIGVIVAVAAATATTDAVLDEYPDDEEKKGGEGDGAQDDARDSGWKDVLYFECIVCIYWGRFW